MTVKQMAATLDIEATNLDPEFGIVLSACVKPWNEEVISFDLRKYQTRGVPFSDDSRLVRAVIEECNKYPILIAHFGMLYDRRFLNSRALFHRGNADSAQQEQVLLNPRGKIIDPWVLAKRHLNKKSNSLDSISRFLGVTDEKTYLNPKVWLRAALDHDNDALDYILEHCVMDVIVLEQVASAMEELTGIISERGSA